MNDPNPKIRSMSWPSCWIEKKKDSFRDLCRRVGKNMKKKVVKTLFFRTHSLEKNRSYDVLNRLFLPQDVFFCYLLGSIRDL